MQQEQQLVAAPPDAYAVCRVLPPITVRINASADAICSALLAHAERATDLLLCTSIDARHVPGRWRAARQGAARQVWYELVDGPLPGLTLSLRADDLGGGATLLHVEGSYLAPVKPLLERRRSQQLAEALRAGLAQRVQHAFATPVDIRIEHRAAPRQEIVIPVRLRLGDMPWSGVTRDVSAGGLGLVVRVTPREAQAARAQILAHTTGAVELLLGEGRLTARVRITRAQPWATGLDVGLRYGTPEEGARLQRRLTELDVWLGAAHR